VVRVADAIPSSVSPSKSATPTCPVNTQLTGLGYQLQGAGGDVFPDDMAPNGALNGALLTAYSAPGFAGSWSLTGYALCAPLPAGAVPTLVSATTASNAASPKDIDSSRCSTTPGRRLTGSGAQLTGALGNVILDQMSPDVFIMQTHARGVEPAPYANNWFLTSFAICW